MCLVLGAMCLVRTYVLIGYLANGVNCMSRFGIMASPAIILYVYAINILCDNVCICMACLHGTDVLQCTTGPLRVQQVATTLLKSNSM